MWSGPRNLSTAMMRSFGARADCTVWDEPFFAPFLQVTGKAHPGREETLAAHETEADKVAEQISSPVRTAYHFLKNMPHHMLEGFPQSWMKTAKHFFLLREPERVIASYAKGRAEFDLDDLGFAPQRRLFDTLTHQTGQAPPVIQSEDILKHPEKALRVLCAAIHIPFDKAMLSWPAGARPEDGAWAPYWYASVENSTGFGAPSQTVPHVPDTYRPYLDQCQDDYKVLAKQALVIS